MLERVADAGGELGGGLLGKCDDHQLVGCDPAAGEKVGDALDEHGCLAGACACLDDKVRV
jgi:hypothetical protein